MCRGRCVYRFSGYRVSFLAVCSWTLQSDGGKVLVSFEAATSPLFTQTWPPLSFGATLPAYFQDEITSDSLIFLLFNKGDLKLQKSALACQVLPHFPKPTVSWRGGVLNSFLLDIFTLSSSLLHPAFLVTLPLY